MEYLLKIIFPIDMLDKNNDIFSNIFVRNEYNPFNIGKNPTTIDKGKIIILIKGTKNKL